MQSEKPEEISRSDIGWHDRGYLPHYENTSLLQTVTYRLADSLPEAVVERMMREAEELADNNPDSDVQREFRRKAEAWLDAGHGSCALREPAHAELVVSAWQYFAGERYNLHAWVVMPNHVHLLVQMIPSHSLGEVVASWKRYTSSRINKRLGRGGSLWNKDYWDRFIRDHDHYANAVRYIHQNPVKAGLVKEPQHWPWSSAALHLQKFGRL